jgi:hypothetical protein
VYVLRGETVGAFQTVTLRSSNGDALSRWLAVNGYAVPDEVRPIIAAYVAEGADFIALRLRPGAGVQEMTPVRVITPGGDPLLPLRMVAAGTLETVDIVLYVIASSRSDMPDLWPARSTPPSCATTTPTARATTSGCAARRSRKTGATAF